MPFSFPARPKDAPLVSPKAPPPEMFIEPLSEPSEVLFVMYASAVRVKFPVLVIAPLEIVPENVALGYLLASITVVLFICKVLLPETTLFCLNSIN